MARFLLCSHFTLCLLSKKRRKNQTSVDFVLAVGLVVVVVLEMKGENERSRESFRLLLVLLLLLLLLLLFHWTVARELSCCSCCPCWVFAVVHCCLFLPLGLSCLYHLVFCHVSTFVHYCFFCGIV